MHETACSVGHVAAGHLSSILHPLVAASPQCAVPAGRAPSLCPSLLSAGQALLCSAYTAWLQLTLANSACQHGGSTTKAPPEDELLLLCFGTGRLRAQLQPIHAIAHRRPTCSVLSQVGAAAASPSPQPDVYELAQISSRRQSVTQDFGRMLEQQAREVQRQQEDASLFPGGSPHASPREGHTASQPRIGPSALYERLKKNLPGVRGTSALSNLTNSYSQC